MFRNILVIKIHQYKCYQQQHAIKNGTFGPPGISVGVQWGSGIKTHSLGGACIGDTGSELQLYVVVYCTHIELD